MPIARLALIRVTFVPRGIPKWLVRVDRVPWTLAIADWRFHSSVRTSIGGVLRGNTIRGNRPERF